MLALSKLICSLLEKQSNLVSPVDSETLSAEDPGPLPLCQSPMPPSLPSLTKEAGWRFSFTVKRHQLTIGIKTGVLLVISYALSYLQDVHPFCFVDLVAGR